MKNGSDLKATSITCTDLIEFKVKSKLVWSLFLSGFGVGLKKCIFARESDIFLVFLLSHLLTLQRAAVPS